MSWRWSTQDLFSIAVARDGMSATIRAWSGDGSCIDTLPPFSARSTDTANTTIASTRTSKAIARFLFKEKDGSGTDYSAEEKEYTYKWHEKIVRDMVSRVPSPFGRGEDWYEILWPSAEKYVFDLKQRKKAGLKDMKHPQKVFIFWAKYLEEYQVARDWVGDAATAL